MCSCNFYLSLIPKTVYSKKEECTLECVNHPQKTKYRLRIPYPKSLELSVGIFGICWTF